tara:strand:- start:459 stop:815 length:357 start_codon:yes stop_codon:yes gene_type:complete
LLLVLVVAQDHLDLEEILHLVQSLFKVVVEQMHIHLVTVVLQLVEMVDLVVVVQVDLQELLELVQGVQEHFLVLQTHHHLDKDILAVVVIMLVLSMFMEVVVVVHQHREIMRLVVEHL